MSPALQQGAALPQRGPETRADKDNRACECAGVRLPSPLFAILLATAPATLLAGKSPHIAARRLIGILTNDSVCNSLV